ncbi:hypothetical protein GEMRC1_001516 [Eukaryota sp. GEM-RC1]
MNVLLNSEALSHVEAYQEYLNIVGEDVSAPLLSQKEFEAKRQKMIDNAHNRVYTFWVNSQGVHCRTVGPATNCVCGHRYRVHAPSSIEEKSSCRSMGCKCRSFDVLPGHGSSYSRCRCKHSAEEHAATGRRVCNRTTCGCEGFISPMTCTCGEPCANHKTMFYTTEQLRAQGRNTENLCGGPSYPTAGGLTNFSSILGESVGYGNLPPSHHSSKTIAGDHEQGPPPAIGSQSELDMLYELKQRQEREKRRSRYRK